MKIRRHKGLLSLAASLFLLCCWVRPATAQLLGPEFQVNSYTTSFQRSPAVAADGSGNFVVAWESYGQDGANSGVFGQRFNSAGSPQGSEFRVNTYTTAVQRDPTVAVDGAGSFVVVWESYSQDGSSFGVFGQRFNSAGSEAGSEFRVNTYTTGSQNYPAVAADGSGGFVVAWQSQGQDGSAYGVFGQRFDSAGSRVGSEFQVNSFATDDQTRPAVAADSSGNFVVAWNSLDEDGSSWGVFGQRFNSAGSPLGSEFQVNSYTTDAQWVPAVATDSSGNFLVAWSSNRQDGSSWGVFGQQFSSTGSRVGSEFQVNTYTTNYQEGPAVAADGSGNFVVAWNSYSGQDGSGGPGVFGQRYAFAGGSVGSEFQINSYTTGAQAHPTVAAGNSGNFVVAWDSYDQDGSNDGVFGQRVATPISGCAADGATLCLRANRFQVEISWRNYAGQTGFGQAVPFSDESGLFWFFSADNIEFLVKVIDGCGLNSRYWVYAAATTDVEYTMTVTDTLRDVANTYENPLGTASPAITDSAAFATCP